MSDVLTSFRYWNRANHRHHHSFDPGNEVPGLPATTSRGTTWVQSTAPDTAEASFCFWSESGGTEMAGIAEVRQWAEAYPPGDATATLTAWYLGPGGGGPVGVGFDAFSTAAGDFLDWGDTFTPFTVDPADAVSPADDSFASTAAGGVRITAAASWPADPLLVFSHWACFGIPGDGEGGELDVPQRASGNCLAVYASLDGPPDPSRRRWPPEILLQGDPARVTRAVLGSLAVMEQARGLPDVADRAAINEVLLRRIGALVDAELKSDPQAKH
jgi:hypothetical protein